jgi:hypothetical protein
MMMTSLNMYLKRIFTLLSQYWWTTVMGVILIVFWVIFSVGAGERKHRLFSGMSPSFE